MTASPEYRRFNILVLVLSLLIIYVSWDNLLVGAVSLLSRTINSPLITRMAGELHQDLAFQNAVKAEERYRKAILLYQKMIPETTDPKALSDLQFGLGTAYACGRGISQNYPLAAMWLEKSAQNGNVLAPIELDQLKDFLKEKEKGK